MTTTPRPTTDPTPDTTSAPTPLSAPDCTPDSGSGTVHDARARLDRAQELLDRLTDDIARVEEFLAHLEASAARAADLGAYHREAGQADLRTVLDDDPAAITPPVANEDAAWDVLATLHDQHLRLLRVVTVQLTRELDSDRC